MAENSPTHLHTHCLSKAQQALCNKNPTYRARIADLHDINNELQKIQRLHSEQEAGKIPGSTKSSLMKKRRKSQRKTLELQHEVAAEAMVFAEAQMLEEDRTAYQDLFGQLMEWDDECAALAESLLSRPKASMALLSILKALTNSSHRSSAAMTSSNFGTGSGGGRCLLGRSSSNNSKPGMFLTITSLALGKFHGTCSPPQLYSYRLVNLPLPPGILVLAYRIFGAASRAAVARMLRIASFQSAVLID